MSNQLILSISIDHSDEIQCMPAERNQSGLGLSVNGITWKEDSDAVLFLNEHKELMIERISDSEVVVCRGGRRCALQAGHPILILQSDCIYIGNHEEHAFFINKIYRTHKPESWLSKLSKSAMLASAAALVMSCMTACHPSFVPERPEGDVMMVDPAEEGNNDTDNTDKTEVDPVDAGNPVEEKHMGDCAKNAGDNPDSDNQAGNDDAVPDSDAGVKPVEEGNPVKGRLTGKVVAPDDRDIQNPDNSAAGQPDDRQNADDLSLNKPNDVEKPDPENLQMAQPPKVVEERPLMGDVVPVQPRDIDSPKLKEKVKVRKRI